MRRRVSDKELIRGRRVLVVAALPKPETEQRADTGMVLEAEEALISTIRAVLAEGATVELVADQALALLGAVIAGEFHEPEAAEGGDDEPGWEQRRASFLHIHPLGSIDDTLEPFTRMGAADVFGDDWLETVGRLAAAQSALICIGDAPVRACLDVFRQFNSRAPVFTYATTGRSAAALAESEEATAVDVEVAQEEPPRSRRRELEERRDFRSHRGEPDWELPMDAEFEFSPAPLIAQLIVERIQRSG